MNPKRAAKLLPIGLLGALSGGCLPHDNTFENRVVPAEEFSRSVKEGKASDFSIFRAVKEHSQEDKAAELQRASLASPGSDANGAPPVTPDAQGDPRYLSKGLALKRSFSAPPEQDFVSDGDVAGGTMPKEAYRQLPRPPQLPQLPPGSASPYATGQMTGNPSLWPDEAQGANYFTDFRAFQAMDVITVLVNESTVGSKKTKSDSEGKYSLLASITNFLGLETHWSSNNEGLDPTALINATTNNKYEGKGEMKREGALKAQISAVIMEILPNGVMRVEGTKIVSVDGEEETMVISGLVRMRDVNADNQVDSNRVANMRVDFYGRGILGEQQTPGWGARLFEYIWPF